MSTSALPVSKAWYASFLARLSSALPQEYVPMAVERLHAYMNGSYCLSEEKDITMRYVFALMGPEIDKAMQRSARARQCALRRRSAAAARSADPARDAAQKRGAEKGEAAKIAAMGSGAPGMASAEKPPEAVPLPVGYDIMLRALRPRLSRSERRRREMDARRLSRRVARAEAGLKGRAPREA